MKIKERVFFEKFESLYYFHGSSQNWAMQDFHFHNQYEILLFLNDGATLEVGSRTYSVTAGDLFLLNNKEYHRISGAPGKPHNRYVLMFEPELLQHMAGAFEYEFAMFFENRSSDFVHRLHLTEGNQAKVEKLLGKIEEIINHGKEDRFKVKLKLSILELIETINEMYEFFMREQEEQESCIETAVENINEEKGRVEFKDPVLNRERIDLIKKYISTHVEEKMELDDIAKKFYISRYYLSHYFKKETGFTLVQYITNQKIVAAKALLKKGYSVTDVAINLSYNSDSHFISVFKKSSGITPKQYAKEKNDNIT